MGLPYDDATAARLKGELLIKDGNSWRYADRVWVKQSGTWRSSETYMLNQVDHGGMLHNMMCINLSLHLMIIIMVLEILPTTMKFKRDNHLVTTQ